MHLVNPMISLLYFKFTAVSPVLPTAMNTRFNFLVFLVSSVLISNTTQGNENVLLHNSHLWLTLPERNSVLRFSTSGVSILDVGSTN